MEPQFTFVEKYLQYFVGALTTVMVAVFSYAVNIGNRTTALETKVDTGFVTQKEKDEDLKEFIKGLMDAKFDGLNTRLARIEANGNGHSKVN